VSGCFHADPNLRSPTGDNESIINPSYGHAKPTIRRLNVDDCNVRSFFENQCSQSAAVMASLSPVLCADTLAHATRARCQVSAYTGSMSVRKYFRDGVFSESRMRRLLDFQFLSLFWQFFGDDKTYGCLCSSCFEYTTDEVVAVAQSSCDESDRCLCER
jgi:hypothetical protein